MIYLKYSLIKAKSFVPRYCARIVAVLPDRTLALDNLIDDPTRDLVYLSDPEPDINKFWQRVRSCYCLYNNKYYSANLINNFDEMIGFTIDQQKYLNKLKLLILGELINNTVELPECP